LLGPKKPGQVNDGGHLAAWVGLVPRQPSSGRSHDADGHLEAGYEHLRSLLVHGTLAFVRMAPSKTDPNNAWINQLRQRRGVNRAKVAVANKNLRIIRGVLRTSERYRAAF
jgi:transposase